MSFLAFTGLSNFLTSAAMAVIVYRKCPRRDLARSNALLNGVISFWSFFYFIWQCAKSASSAELPFQLLMLGGIWINQSFLHFTFVFLGMTPSRRVLLRLCAIINVFFSWFIFSGQMFSGFEPRFGYGFWPLYGTAFVPYLVFWHLELFYAFFSLVKSVSRFQGLERQQIRYLITAFAIGYFGGIFNWPLWFGINIPPYANILITVYVSTVAYAIVKHQLMNINFIIRKTMIYSLVTAMLTGVYLLLATQLTRFFSPGSSSSGLWPSAVAAGVITLLFNPLLNKVRALMDRQFFGDWLRDMSRGVVHEVKRPLATLSVPAEMTLLDLEDIEQGKKSLAALLPTLKKRMRYIMNQTLEAGARIEALEAVSGVDPDKLESVDLRQVLESLSGCQPLIDSAKIKIERDISEAPLIVKGNQKQFAIVFMNLAKNAMEAMRDRQTSDSQGVLSVKAHADGRWIVVLIQDTGPGIATADLEHLFSPYFTTKGAHGIGLGLYLTQKIIHERGGTISVQSTAGKGTAFTVKLPRET